MLYSTSTVMLQIYALVRLRESTGSSQASLIVYVAFTMKISNAAI